MATNMSLPPSSPRLPSPPPAAEIQIGPKSPAMGPNAARQGQLMEQTAIDANAKRRIHPGTKSADMAAGPPLVPLQELDSAFQLQEHLAALHYYHTASNTIAMTRETAKTLATPPQGIDKTLWLYELCRFLVGQCNSLIVGFLFDTPPCSAATCPEMRASEWQFLCAVHDAPKSCCAIDYCCHTLDWAANVVTNPKIFPSRFVVDAHDRAMAIKNLINVFRRLHRIFAHAWFQHRVVFWSVEGQTGLYIFFKTVCDVYDLLPAENYKLPPEAEGLEAAEVDNGAERKIILQHQPQQQPGSRQVSVQRAPLDQAEDDSLAPARTNTRRHIKSSPSTGSAVTTVPEADEDETAADVTNRLRQMHISNSAAAVAAATVDEEMELATIPVIVEHDLVEQPIRPSSVVPISGPGSMSAMRAFDIPELELQEMVVPEMDVDVQLEPDAKPEPGLESEPLFEPFEPHPTPELEFSPPPAVPDAPTKEVDSKPVPTPATPEPEAPEKTIPEEQTPAVPQSAPETAPNLPAEKQEEPTASAPSDEVTSASPTSTSSSAPEGETASETASISVPTPPASEGEPGAEDDDAEVGEIQVAIASPSPSVPAVDVKEEDAKAEEVAKPSAVEDGEKKVETATKDE
ncbi:Mob1/phocein [Cercophora newfieldiana]|uniref:Mob1/phocein n=1 Tax=Cercophora newfieldiana TaxID=92897 RepID=A0AA39Y0Q2_9PEZI|nr:Mob1/phocein [Cercophora newfieldiana]